MDSIANVTTFWEYFTDTPVRGKLSIYFFSLVTVNVFTCYQPRIQYLQVDAVRVKRIIARKIKPTFCLLQIAKIPFQTTFHEILVLKTWIMSIIGKRW